jgi:[ribosomal protein S18]-alanine N-acetyltransferase
MTRVEPTVRAAVADDVAAIAALEERAFPTDPWSSTLITEGVAGRVPTVRFLVAESDHGFAGHAVVSVAAETAELQRIAVPEDVRRRGTGTALLARVRAHAAAAGAERLLLEVREDNAAARKFYEGHGFSEVARRGRYYRDGVDAVILETGLGG